MNKKQIRILISVGFLVITSLYSSLSKRNSPLPRTSNQLASVPLADLSVSTQFVMDTTDKTRYKVRKVIDGDTIQIEKVSGDKIDGDIKDIVEKETVRLIGINTPETVDPRKKVECFGKEASLRAKELLVDQSVRIETDPTQTERDKYGRLLAYVYLEDGRLFNKLMIEEGYAYEYTYNKAYRYQSEFKQAQVEAQEENRGLWAENTCNGVK